MKSSTTTVIGRGCDTGVALPLLFFVFEDKRVVNYLMTGATPGAGGTISDYGWSNTKVFKQYLSGNFFTYVSGITVIVSQSNVCGYKNGSQFL